MSPEAHRPFDGDRELLDGFRRGDRQALERVYWAYIDPVERMVRRCLAYLGANYSRGKGQVEDLVQEVFVRAFSREARSAYDGLRDYGRYLFGITRNAVADALRISRREVLTDDAQLGDQAAPEDSGAADTDVPLWADRSTLAHVKDYLTSLPADLRSLHHQRYVLGLSQQAAAQALGVSRQQVRTLEKRLRVGVSRELKRARTANTSTSLAASPVVKIEPGV